MTHLPGKFVWFEHVSGDVANARAFYGRLMSWATDSVPVGDQSYYMIQNAGVGIGGFRAAPDARVPSHWIGYMSVQDVDAAAARAQRAGAKVLMPPTDFAPVGRGATLADPVGATFAIWKSAQGDRPDIEGKAPAGDWHWMELAASDREKAVRFYAEAFGYTRQTMPMPTGPYEVLMRDGKPRGGIVANAAAGAPSYWMPYVAVADCDATAAAARAAGAQVSVPPSDIPDIGRIAVLVDPLGAVIGVIRPA